MGEGAKKFQEAGQKIKAEVEAKQEQVAIAKTDAINSLTALKDNPNLAKMYQESARLGTDNLGGESPQLKVHATGRSNNELANGGEPVDGNFFYKPTAQEYDSVTCHILTISRGFRAEGMEQKDGTKKQVFNQLLGGVFIDDGEYRPFLMYFTGLKLSNLWEFGKSIRKHTAKGIPMFALTVTLTTEKKANDYGKSWVVNFDIVKDEEGNPKLVLDEGIFQFLKENVQTTEEMIDSLIQAKETGKDEIKPLTTANVVVDGENQPF